MEIDRITYQFEPSARWSDRTPDEYAIILPRHINSFMSEILLATERMRSIEDKVKVTSAARRFVSRHIFGLRAVSEFDHEAGERLDRVFVESWDNFKKTPKYANANKKGTK